MFPSYNLLLLCFVSASLTNVIFGAYQVVSVQTTTLSEEHGWNPVTDNQDTQTLTTPIPINTKPLTTRIPATTPIQTEKTTKKTTKQPTTTLKAEKDPKDTTLKLTESTMNITTNKTVETKTQNITTTDQTPEAKNITNEKIEQPTSQGQTDTKTASIIPSSTLSPKAPKESLRKTLVPVIVIGVLTLLLVMVIPCLAYIYLRMIRVEYIRQKQDAQDRYERQLNQNPMEPSTESDVAGEQTNTISKEIEHESLKSETSSWLDTTGQLNLLSEMQKNIADAVPKPKGTDPSPTPTSTPTPTPAGTEVNMPTETDAKKQSVV